MGRVLSVLGALWAAAGLLLPAEWLVRTAAPATPAWRAAVESGATLHKLFMVLLGLSAVAVGVLLGRARRPAAGGPRLRYGHRRDWAWLGAILAGALALRLVGLGSSLWYDEIATLVDFVRLPGDQLALTYTSLNNHMLFSLLARASVVAFGESAWALRLPAVGFGVLSIAATWWLALQVVDRREALLVAALMSVSYHHVWFSQNARGYTGLLFFTVVATALFLAGMRRRGRGLWVAYAAVFALAMYVHLSAVFAFLAHTLVYGVLFVWRRAPVLRARLGVQDRLPGAGELWPLLGFAFGSMIILSMYGMLFPQMVQVYQEKMSLQKGSGITEWQNPLWTALELLRGLAVNPVMAVGIPVGGALMTVGFVRFARANPLLAVLLVIHVPLTLAILVAIDFHIWPRYFLVDMGFFLIILVHGTTFVAGWLGERLGLTRRWSKEALGTFAVVLGILVSAATVPRNYQLPKQDFDGAVAFVEGARAPGDAVVTLGIITDSLTAYYDKPWPAIETPADLPEAERTWLLATFPAQLRSHHPEMVEALARDFELVKTFPGTLGGGEVNVYRRGR